MNDNLFEMERLAIDDIEKADYMLNKVDINKKLSKTYSTARKRAKLKYCYYCKQSVSSFCNSHSIPKFALKEITDDGKVYYPNTIIDLPFWSKEKGLNDAGTFQIICRECDSKIFQDYENPEKYLSAAPSGKMLAQIAVKNYLQMISKRLQEKELHSMLYEEHYKTREYIQKFLNVEDLDLIEYNTSFDRAKIAAEKVHNNWYHICYYKELNYIVPIAFQGVVVLISDLNDEVVNNIYNLDPTYNTKELHICVFPLKETSVIFLFIDSRDKRYRKFYRQLQKLPLEEQLSLINYIIFSYSENVYISKKIDDRVFENKAFIDTCQKTCIATAPLPFGNALDAAISDFSLKKHINVPNLLSIEYALSTPQDRG